MRPIGRVEPGHKLSVSEFDTFNKGAAAAIKASGSGSVRVVATQAGIGIDIARKPFLRDAPVQYVSAVNVGVDDLEVFDVAQITDPVQTQSQPADNTGQPLSTASEWRFRPVVEALKPTEPQFGRFGICVDRIPAYGGSGAKTLGRVAVGGIFVCRVARGHGAFQSSLARKVDRADTVAGETYLQTCELGAAKILWLDKAVSGNAAHAASRWAVVQFGERVTSGVGIGSWSNRVNDGVVEVLIIRAPATVSEVASGTVEIDV